ncbi:50S ribosomal protein L10, partial [Candidatus Dojkabacteria bacterium]|nr:50S ribosomal protein L10 [Candidatus Dojkabacteria bacterium]
LDGAQLTVDQAISLADMPSKEESIAMILGIIDSALGGVVNVLNDAPRSFVTILDQAFKEE